MTTKGNIKPTAENHRLKLSKCQQLAYDRLVQFTTSSHQFFRLSGAAGTGKSYLIVEFIRYLQQQKIKYVVAAPTNKAAQNIQQIANANQIVIEAITVAKLLGQLPEIDRDTGKEDFIANEDLCKLSEFDIALIDEYSMISADNFAAIVAQTIRKTKIVFVGDLAQLPPVNEKVPVVAQSPLIKVSVELQEIVRYDGEIARVAATIRTNSLYARCVYPFSTTEDLTVVKAKNREQWLHKIADLIADSRWQKDSNFCRAIAYRNETVNAINDSVRQRWHGSNCAPFLVGDLLIAKSPCFRQKMSKVTGKKEWVTVVQNSEEMRVSGEFEIETIKTKGTEFTYYSVPVSTESGFSISLKILTATSQILWLELLNKFAESKRYIDRMDLFKSFDVCPFGYALTCHKAQGSSIDYVFIDVRDMSLCHERQPMFYTALTRAKKRAVVY
ncbi:ATP-dependent DNA helicase [Merismopedia glauca]|uniref:RNA helicase n=1 Tax=Merismopedia glauca CCAP 1448/3 TaxID=1296344 RepID=A0A2T1BWU7_9CYAN|nr:AAA family ATPase [Merismopedia glauca]PSB00394.1 RNA helicase [Merismopedia glauca CCAP 1448/3]